MGYNDLTQLTLTEDERMAEAQRILNILERESSTNFSPNQQDFVRQMKRSRFVSVKQLLYLRDILAKVQ